MSHLNINGVDKTLDHVYVKARTENLAYGRITSVNIEANGMIKQADSFDVAIARVENGVVYTANSYVLAFYTEEPVTGSVSYNSSRIVATQGIPTTFTAPITGYAAFRIAPSELAMLNSGSTIKPYYPYLITKEAWEARDKNDHLLWGRADTFTGTSSISARCYGLPVKSWEIDGNSQQSGTPAPEDPIDPEFVGERTGNLADEKIENAFVSANGEVEGNPAYDLMIIPVIAGSQYTFYYRRDYIQNYVIAYFVDKPTIGSVSFNSSREVYYYSDTPQVTIAVPSGVTYIAIRMPKNGELMFNLGSTAKPYEPYGYKLPITSANQTVPVYLGQVQTVRRVKKLVLTGDENWIYYPVGNLERFYCDDNVLPTADYTIGYSTHYIYKYISANNHIFIASNVRRLYVYDNRYASASDFKTYLAAQYAANTPVVVWYVLATPETAIVNEPLAKIGTYADILTSAQAGITIPTTDGSTTISVDTALAPSKFEVKVHAKPIHYGFKIDKSVSDPSNAVIYTHDAVTMTPAGMDFANGVFDYGSWENVWFIKGARPVMLNFDGTEAYDLDPNDYSKKLDGTPSDIADSTKNLNAMIAFPTVWIKRTDDASYNYIEISDRQLDNDFHAYAHEDANGAVKPYIYLPIYKGSLVDGKLRSISGVKPQSGTTAQQEVDAASALGTGWQIWDYTSKEMLCDLLTLISKSLDTQGKFGQGHSTGGSSASDFLDCGTLNNKGKFFGYSATTSQVKCFGMEALWAERWDRELGLILDAGVYKIKEHPTYNLTGEGYTAISTSVAECPTSNNCIKTEVSTQFGSLPTIVGGTSSTYYCDYFYQNQSDVRVALRGGSCSSGANAGLRYVYVGSTASGSTWYFGASPVYK